MMFSAQQSRPFIYSMLGHFALLAVSFFLGLSFFSAPPELELPDIVVIDSAEFDKMVAEAKSGNFQETDEAPKPETVDKVEENIVENTASSEDISSEPITSNTDMTAQLEVEDQTEIFEEGIAPPDSLGLEQSSEATNKTNVLPRNSALIAEIARQFEESRKADTVIETVSEQINKEVVQEEIRQEDTPENSISEIRPEADINADLSAAPVLSVAMRPRNLDTTPRQPENAEVNTQEQASSIDNLLLEVIGEDLSISGGAGNSNFDASPVTNAINRNWNKASIIDKDNYTRLVTTVQFKTDKAGNLTTPITLVAPSSPDDDYLIAFQSVQRAIIATTPLPIPSDWNDDSFQFNLSFDPVNGVGLVGNN